MSPRSIPFVIGMSLGILACSKTAPETTTTTASSASTPASAPPPASPPSGAGMTIPQKFEAEAKNRPAGTVRVEDVTAAFTAAGADIREEKQHLGSPYLAKYCVGLKTGEDIHASICEYDDEKTAVDGMKQSEKAFMLPNRSLHRNGATTLTLRLGKNGADDQALAKKMIAAFESLRPPSK